jgi:hypothetical protein
MFILLPLPKHIIVTQHVGNYLLTSSNEMSLTSKQTDKHEPNLLWCEISFNSPEEGNTQFPKRVPTMGGACSSDGCGERRV